MSPSEVERTPFSGGNTRLAGLDMTTARSIVALVALAVAAASAWEPRYARAIADRAELRAELDPILKPEYRLFVKELTVKARPGEVVAMVSDAPNAPRYVLVMHALVSHRVIAANAATGKSMDRLGEADLVAVWPASLGVPAPFREVERFYGGVIARR